MYPLGHLHFTVKLALELAVPNELMAVHENLALSSPETFLINNLASPLLKVDSNSGTESIEVSFLYH